jgi:hypothetical protein
MPDQQRAQPCDPSVVAFLQAPPRPLAHFPYARIVVIQ